MSDLIPEKRVDKNGKAVTRHISASAGGPSEGQKRIPVPSSGPDPKKLARDAMARLKTNDIDLLKGSYQNSVLYYLASISPDLMENVVESALAANEDEAKVWFYYLGDLPGAEKRSPAYDTLWRKYQNLAPRIPTASYLVSTSPYSSYMNQTRNLMSVVDYAYPDKRDDPDFMRAASIVLHLNDEITPLKGFLVTPDYSKYLNEIEFIAKRVDEVETVIPILRQRRSTSIGVVDAILESGAASLSEGML